MERKIEAAYRDNSMYEGMQIPAAALTLSSKGAVLTELIYVDDTVKPGTPNPYWKATGEVYPDDYDGAICFYPVLYYVHKNLKDSGYGTTLQELGPEAVISPEDVDRMLETILRINTESGAAEDGLIMDFAAAKASRPAVRAALAAFLNEKQLAFLDAMEEPMQLPFPLAYGETALPGYAVYEGAPLRETINGYPLTNVFERIISVVPSISAISPVFISISGTLSAPVLLPVFGNNSTIVQLPSRN